MSLRILQLVGDAHAPEPEQSSAQCKTNEMNFRKPYTKPILSVGDGLMMIQAGDIYSNGDRSTQETAGGGSVIITATVTDQDPVVLEPLLWEQMEHQHGQASCRPPLEWGQRLSELRLLWSVEPPNLRGNLQGCR